MKKFVVKKAGKKGKGLFTTAPLLENECIFSVDLSGLQPPRPGTKLSKEEWNHLDYAGRVHTNFFRQPLSIQKKYYEFLPPSIRRKYRTKFEEPNGRR